MERTDFFPDCTFGNVRLAVSTMSYTEGTVKAFYDKCMAVYSKHLLEYRFPMKELETEEDWRIRVKGIQSKEKIRRKDESIEDHRARILKPAAGDIHTVAQELIEAIAQTFQPDVKITDELFKQANWLDVKLFIFDILNLADIPCDDFMPKRAISQKL